MGKPNTSTYFFLLFDKLSKMKFLKKVDSSVVGLLRRYRLSKMRGLKLHRVWRF